MSKYAYPAIFTPEEKGYSITKRSAERFVMEYPFSSGVNIAGYAYFDIL